jgi:hypothetical protein
MVVVSTFLGIMEVHDSNLAPELDTFSQSFQENAKSYRIVGQERFLSRPFQVIIRELLEYLSLRAVGYNVIKKIT